MLASTEAEGSRTIGVVPASVTTRAPTKNTRRSSWGAPSAWVTSRTMAVFAAQLASASANPRDSRLTGKSYQIRLGPPGDCHHWRGVSGRPCKPYPAKLPYGVMKKIPIHWDDLESSFERNAPDTESFLEISTGYVVSLTAGDPETPSLRAKVAANIGNYIRIDPASSREQYRWMERFVGSVTEPQLRERLVMAIDGKGAFRRFKDVLLAYPAERERWFTYRADLLHWHMHQWLIEHEIEPTTPAPWGEAKPPPELGDAVP